MEIDYVCGFVYERVNKKKVNYLCWKMNGVVSLAENHTSWLPFLIHLTEYQITITQLTLVNAINSDTFELYSQTKKMMFQIPRCMKRSACIKGCEEYTPWDEEY